MLIGKVNEEELVAGMAKGLESIVVVSHVEDMEHQHVEGKNCNDGVFH